MDARKKDDGYEEDLDTYFVDRLRFLNAKGQRTQLLKQRFKERNGRIQASEVEGDENSLAVVCVDGSPAADEALRFALTQLPQAQSLVLAHGIRVSLASSHRAGTPPFGEDASAEQRHEDLERRYLKTCREAGKHCMVKHFTYTTRGGFGHAVCYLADKKDAASIVIGQRHPRPLLGASSTAVMKYCGRRPVVLVPDQGQEERHDHEDPEKVVLGDQ